jgi:hypothetical protein
MDVRRLLRAEKDFDSRLLKDAMAACMRSEANEARNRRRRDEFKKYVNVLSMTSDDAVGTNTTWGLTAPSGSQGGSVWVAAATTAARGRGWRRLGDSSTARSVDVSDGPRMG